MVSGENQAPSGTSTAMISNPGLEKRGDREKFKKKGFEDDDIPLGSSCTQIGAS